MCGGGGMKSSNGGGRRKRRREREEEERESLCPLFPQYEGGEAVGGRAKMTAAKQYLYGVSAANRKQGRKERLLDTPTFAKRTAAVDGTRPSSGFFPGEFGRNLIPLE